jgi:hypothetical protein
VTEVHLDARFIALYDHWNKKRGKRLMPARRQIDAVEFPARLPPYLFMVDLSDNPPRWRYRFVGTAMVERVGVDLTGRFHADVLGTKYCRYLTTLNDEVFERKHPIYTETMLYAKEGGALLTKRLLLPLAHLGPEPAIILGAQTYHGGSNAPPHSLVLTDRCEIEERSRHALDWGRHRLTRPKNHEAAKLRTELERYRSLLLFNTDPQTARVLRALIAQVEARLQELRRALSDAKP